MKIYEIEITADVTSSVTKAYPIEANSMDEAKAKAREQFEEEMEVTNSVLKVRNIEFGYTGVLKKAPDPDPMPTSIGGQMVRKMIAAYEVGKY